MQKNIGKNALFVLGVQQHDAIVRSTRTTFDTRPTCRDDCQRHLKKIQPMVMLCSAQWSICAEFFPSSPSPATTSKYRIGMRTHLLLHPSTCPTIVIDGHASHLPVTSH